MKVAYAGEPGAFGELAARAVGPKVEAVPCADFHAVARAVRDGEVPAGVVPVENSIAGPVAQGIAAVLEVQPEVCGEVRVRVRHLLLGRKGLRLAEVREVHSHPQALAQCRRFLEANGLRAVAEANTATAARRVAEGRWLDGAAIASRGAAERLGLEVIAEGIADAEVNETRFYVLGRVDGGGPRTVGVLAMPGEGGGAGPSRSGDRSHRPRVPRTKTPVSSEHSLSLPSSSRPSLAQPRLGGLSSGGPISSEAGSTAPRSSELGSPVGSCEGVMLLEWEGDGPLPPGGVLLGRLARAASPAQTDASASTSS